MFPVGKPDRRPPASPPRPHPLYHMEDAKLTFHSFLVYIRNFFGENFIHTDILSKYIHIRMAYRLIVYMSMYISVLCTVNLYAISVLWEAKGKYNVLRGPWSWEAGGGQVGQKAQTLLLSHLHRVS